MKIKKIVLMLLFVLGVSRVMANPIGYSISGSDSLYSFDLTTGADTLIGPLGVSGDFEALAFDPTSGILYTASDGGSLYTVNTTTGAATFVGSLGVSYTNGGMAFDMSGQGFLITSNGLFSFDKSTGAASLIGDSGTGLSGGAFVGNTLYATGDNSSTHNLVTVNTLTGAITTVGPLGFQQSDQSGLSYDSGTDSLYMLNEGSNAFYTVNYTTGAATFLSSYVGSFESIAIMSAVGAPDINVTDSVNPNDDLLIPFGLVEMGDYSEEETVTVTNSGDADLIVGKVHLAGGGQGPSSEDMVHEKLIDFIITSDNCNGETIAPEESCTITVQFIPENTCRRKAQLLIHSDDPDEKVVHVRLEGISKGQTMSRTASLIGITYDEQTSEITFPNGPVSIDDEQPVLVNIFNQSNTSKVIHEVVLLDGDADRFSIDMNPESNACNKLPHSLQSSESCNISLSYSPIEYGSDHTTLGVFAEENTCYFLDVTGINSSLIAPPPYGFSMR